MAKHKKGRKKAKRGGCVVHVPVQCKQVTKHANPEKLHHKAKKAVKNLKACVMRYRGKHGISLKAAWRKAKLGEICRAGKKKAKNIIWGAHSMLPKGHRARTTQTIFG